MKKSITKLSTQSSSSKKKRLLGFVLIISVGIVGTVILAFSHAATSTVAVEAEEGVLSNSVLIVDSTTASKGKAVKFASETGSVGSNTPCTSKQAPAQWKHVVVLMFENKKFNDVIGKSSYPYISTLASKCGTYTNWQDANIKVNGTSDGYYSSKPNYATLTSGVSPSIHGINSNSYSSVSDVDNIFNRLNLNNKSAKSYSSGSPAGCSKSNFNGSYHDPMRYYTNLGGISSSSTTYCNTHQANIDNFMSDVNNNNLPMYSFILPTNDENTHNNSAASGDAWANAFLSPLFESARYKSGDTAVFFLWDEDTPIPNILIAPSIKPGSHPVLASGSNPISHFSALRTWQEMLGITPLLGDSGQAPSLLNYYNGQP